MDDDQMHFAVKSLSLSRYGGRKPQTLRDASRHNLREIQAERGANSHIDPLRTHKNLVLAGPDKASAVVDLGQKIAHESGVDIRKLRKDHCQAIELIFSLPIGSTIDAATYFEKCLAWTRQAYRLPVLLATAHYDEAAKHMHVLLLPVMKGIYVGSKPISKAATRENRESFFQEVAGPSGLTRSRAKLYGIAKAWGVTAVLKRVDEVGLQQCVEALWPILLDAIKREPTQAMRALHIDLRSIRPTSEPKINAPFEKTIGFEISTGKAMDFTSTTPEDRKLSCVGFSPKQEHPNRLKLAQVVQCTGLDRHITDQSRSAVATVALTDGDDFIREKDPDFDPSIWID